VPDLEVSIISPEHKEVTLIDHSCPGNTKLLVMFDDKAGVPVQQCLDSGSDPVPVLPAQCLGPTYKGDEAQGNWTLKIIDSQVGDVGILNRWSIEFDCATTPQIWEDETPDIEVFSHPQLHNRDAKLLPNRDLAFPLQVQDILQIDEGEFCQVADVNVNVDISHPALHDVQIELTHGAETVMLKDLGCGALDILSVEFNDEANDLPCCRSQKSFETGAKPANSNGSVLSNFDRMSASGNWTLNVHDNYEWHEQGGVLLGWSLAITCTQPEDCPGQYDIVCGTTKSNVEKYAMCIWDADYQQYDTKCMSIDKVVNPSSKSAGDVFYGCGFCDGHVEPIKSGKRRDLVVKNKNYKSKGPKGMTSSTEHHLLRA
jgi:subtilisin-like proprotein convertase family protein